MENNRTNSKVNSKAIAVITGIVAVVIVVSVFLIGKMNKSLYLERANNANFLMEKIAQSVEGELQYEWDLVDFFADELSSVEYSSLESAESQLTTIDRLLRQHDSKQTAFFIDNFGRCYTADNETFMWENVSLLNSDNQEIFVSTVDTINQNSNMMFFVTSMPKEIVVDGVRLTHFCIGCDMTSFDKYFDTKEYKDSSVAFLIKKNGNPLYKQDMDYSIANVYNVLSALKKSEFKYGFTYDDMLNNIQNDIGDCAVAEYDEQVYFVGYRSIDISDWVVVIFIPDEYMGVDTGLYTRNMMSFLAMIFISLIIAVIAIILTIYRDRFNARVRNEMEQEIEIERRASESKTRFLSTMSHEIRTPMNAIIGMVTIAQQHPDDTAQMAECMNEINQSSHHLLNLINDVLDITKIESGKIDFTESVVSIPDTVISLTKMTKQQMSGRELYFDINVYNIDCEYIYTDELRINQLFINILSNAVKYTPDGGSIYVDLYQQPVDDKPDMVRMTYVVADTGIGMSQEFQKDMYNEFARATVDARVRKITGTGLGLPICKQIVDMLGGTIECDSAVDRGTRFTITFDVKIADKDTDDCKLSNIKVLVADTDTATLDTASHIFDSMDVSADTVLFSDDTAYGIEQRLLETSYDVVIFDRNVFDACGENILKSAKSHNKTPKVLISSFGGADDVTDSKRSEVDSYIDKPFFKAVVYDKINKLMSVDDNKAKEDDLSAFAGMRMLVAEDIDMNWKIITKILGHYGIESDRAENGEICVDMINSVSDGFYDVVIMDIQMPVMNGYEASQRIRQSDKEWVKNIPIIAMTADAFSEDIKKCIEAGMNDHVPKPIDVAVLARALKKILGN